MDAPQIKPTNKPSLLSDLTFSYIYPYIRLARSLPQLSSDHLTYHLGRDFEPRQLTSRLSGHLTLYGAESTLKSIFIFLLPYYVLTVLSDVLAVRMEGFRVRLMTDASTAYQESFKIGMPASDQLSLIVKSALTALVSLATAIVYGYSYSRLFYLAIKLRMALTGVIVDRMFRCRLSDLSAKFIRNGRLVNLLSNDVQILQLCAITMSALFVMPFSVYEGISGVLSRPDILTDCLFGIAVLAGYTILQITVALLMIGAMKRVNAASDLRIRLTSNLITNLRAVQRCALHEKLSERVDKVRREEQQAMRRLLFLESASQCLHFLRVPLAQAAAMVSMMRSSDGAVIASDRMTAVNELLRLIADKVFGYVPEVVSSVPGLITSVARFGEYMSIEDDTQSSNTTNIKNASIVLDSATFTVSESVTRLPANLAKILGMPDPIADSGSQQREFVTASLTISLSIGQRCLVIGPSGSGKSVLLESMAGFHKLSSGKMALPSTIGYLPQEAIIMNCSVRDNILLGRPLDMPRLRQCLQQCCLQDVPLAKQCGPGGAQLSGGQKQRVVLARLAYEAPALCIMDDPLSALDPITAAAILRQLSAADDGLLGKSSAIMAVSNPDLTLKHCRVDHVVRVKSFDKIDAEEHCGELPLYVPGDASNDSEDAHHAIMDDTSQQHTENVSSASSPTLRIAKQYVLFAGGMAAVLVILAAYVSEQYLKRQHTGRMGSLVGDSLREGHAIRNYILLTLGMSVAKVIYSFSFTFFHGNAASKLHDQAVSAISRQPAGSVPVGKILSYLSRDMRLVDIELCSSISGLLGFLSVVIAGIVMCATSAPFLLPVVLVMCLASTGLHFLYLAAWRQSSVLSSQENVRLIKRVEECSSGIASLRHTEGFPRRCIDDCYDDNIKAIGRAAHLLATVRRWMTLQFEYMSVGCRLAADVLTILCRVSPVTRILINETMSSINGTFEMLAKKVALTDASLQSFDLILSLCTSVPPEHTTENSTNSVTKKTDAVIEYDNVSFSYGRNSVLRNVSLSINRGERVAIVGKSGAGKSSLFSALFRSEGCRTAGSIYLDGEPISALSQQTLSQRLVCVSQEPVLFHAPLRFNLDPAGEQPDIALADILAVLGLARLASCLDAPLLDDLRLSANQLQTLALARALLRCRPGCVLLLDEVTAKADSAFLGLLAGTIGRLPRSITVLAITHRKLEGDIFDRTIEMASGRITRQIN